MKLIITSQNEDAKNLNALNETERAVLNLFRQLNDLSQAQLIGIAEAWGRHASCRRSPRLQLVHGDES